MEPPKGICLRTFGAQLANNAVVISTELIQIRFIFFASTVLIGTTAVSAGSLVTNIYEIINPFQWSLVARSDDIVSANAAIAS